MTEPDLNAAQRKVFDELLDAGSPGAPADPELRNRLASLIEARLESSVQRWDKVSDDRLWIGKTTMTQVLQCEGFWSARVAATEFEWSLASTAGVVVHYAIQHQHQDQSAEPAHTYIETAIEIVRKTHPATKFFEDVTNAEILELRSQANSQLGQWNDTWPQMPLEWRVQAEPYHVAELGSGSLVISARPDLVIGRVPRRTLARQVILDVKTSAHLPWEAKDDAWFYALVYTLRIGVPPARSVVYSIPSGTWNPEPEVDEGKLLAAIHRLVEAVTRMVDLADGREPRLTPNVRTYCRWCPAQPTCPAYREAATSRAP